MVMISVDIEADGPIPGPYSMVSFGAVVVTEALDERFYATVRPISKNWIPEALNVSGFTRDECMGFRHANEVMPEFNEWLIDMKKKYGYINFASDNAGFDWQFVNWYMHQYIGSNPFGWSSFSLTSFFKGYSRDFRASFKHMRKTKHDHNALNDAIGNAEVILQLEKGCRQKPDGRKAWQR